MVSTMSFWICCHHRSEEHLTTLAAAVWLRAWVCRLKPEQSEMHIMHGHLEACSCCPTLLLTWEMARPGSMPFYQSRDSASGICQDNPSETKVVAPHVSALDGLGPGISCGTWLSYVAYQGMWAFEFRLPIPCVSLTRRPWANFGSIDHQ